MNEKMCLYPLIFHKNWYVFLQVLRWEDLSWNIPKIGVKPTGLSDEKYN
jgi:hypothetical protein